MNFEILETDRLKLRKVTPEEYKYVFTNYTDAELKNFFGINTEEELTLERNRYENGLATFNRSVLYFHVIEKTTDKVIGQCGYHTWYKVHNRAELFYILFNDIYKRKGFISEALIPVIEYGFNAMNLHRIEAFVGPENPASIRLMEKFRFTKEGHLREHYCNKGTMEDSLVYSLLKKEA